MRSIVALLSCSFLVMGTLSLTTSMSESSEAGLGSGDNVMYTISSPITIASNMDFSTYANGGGNGSAGNPWILEDYEIDGNEYTYCIYITNTTDHFVVRNCYFYKSGAGGNTGSGLLTENVQNGTILNNTISHNFYGIYMGSSSNNLINNNNVSWNYWSGVHSFLSHNNTLFSNSASHIMKFGIYLEYSDDTLISKNNVSWNDDTGICISSSCGTVLTNNSASSNGNHGIRLGSSERTLIDNNTAWDNEYGITLKASDHNTIFNNNASLNYYLGIYLEHSNNNTISNNIVSFDPIGFYLSGSDNNTLSWNTVFLNNGDGISVMGSNNGTFLSNNISLNGNGLSLYRSNDNRIEYNIVSSNREQGISLELLCDHNLVAHNLASSNSDGIFVHGSGNIIVDNDASMNDRGIYCDPSTSGIIIDNRATFNGDGLCFDSSSKNMIINNTVSSNHLGMRFDFFCNDNIISNNTVCFNYWGMEIHRSNRNNITGSNVSWNERYGVVIVKSLYNSILNDRVVHNGDVGIHISIDSHITTIKDNTLSYNKGDGIYIEGSDNNIVSYNLISFNEFQGIDIYRSMHSSIINNDVLSNDDGIYLESCDNITIADNTLYSNEKDGVSLDRSSGCSIERNTVTDNENGIFIASSDDCAVENNTVGSNNYGVYVRRSERVTLIGNNASLNRGAGIYIFFTSCHVMNNTACSNGGYGIHIDRSDGSTITRNNASDNSIGIFIESSNNDMLIDNTAFMNDQFGIYLSGSIGITLIGNAMMGDGVGIKGGEDQWDSHHIDTSNTVNGKQVFYWNYGAAGKVPLDAGQIILASCANMIVEGQNINDVGAGIQVGFSSNIDINNNNLSRNRMSGIHLYSSNLTTVINNTVSCNGEGPHPRISCFGINLERSYRSFIYTNDISSNDEIGIQVYQSDYNLISENVVDRNTGYGLYIWYSDNNTIIQNIFSGNGEYGIGLGPFSSENMVYHNSFLDNTVQAYDEGQNSWDNGYPDGGNFWSDYIGIDLNYSPLQEKPPSDGIGDTSYMDIEGPAEAQDNYPLMRPWSEDKERPVAEAGPDQIVNMGDSVTLNGSGSKDDVGIVSYTWRFFDLGIVTLDACGPTYRFDNAGVFLLTLNVTDADGEWDLDTMQVIVKDTSFPVALAGPDIYVNMGDTVVFDAFASEDNVGMVNFTWTFDDKGVVTLYGMYAMYRFDNAGSFSVVLCVTDLAGNWDTDILFVNVNDTELPIANAGPDRTAERGKVFTFDASASSDNVGIMNYTWKFYEGSDLIVLSGKTVERRFMVPGEYNITLIVKDRAGNTAWDNMWITIEEHQEDDDDIWSVTGYWWIVLVLAVALILICIGFFVLKRKDRDEEE